MQNRKTFTYDIRKNMRRSKKIWKQIDGQINEAAKGWRTDRMGK